MRVVMTSLGAMGDVEPFVALADELRHHGHETVFALPAHLLPNARRRGFDGIQLGSERLSELYQAATRAYEYGEASEEEALYYAALMEAAPQAFQDLAGLCSQSDLLISMSVMPLGRMIHELTGIPFISVQIQHPNDSIEIPAELNGFRAQLGLPPVEDPSLHGISPQMMLVAIAPELLPAGYNPPPHYHVTGFFLPEQEDWQPDPALAADRDHPGQYHAP
jgi:sterol 3beta-glucosyltransferase